MAALAALVAVLLAAAGTASPATAADSATGGTVGTVGGEQLATTGVVVDAPGATALPTLDASAYVLADLTTGVVLAAKNPHGRFRPASTLKTLTALTLLPQLDPATSYTARFDDANAEGSRAGLVPDATYTVAQMWQALWLVSGNDAAQALASAAGGVPQTVAAMNDTAQRIGARDTHAVNPSGLDASGQLTSAYDLAVIARAGMARGDFRMLASTVKAQFPGKMPKPGHVRTTFQIYTQDRLLLNYRGAIGIKTGWTTKARGTFVGAATRNGRTLVATVLHSPGDSWKDSASLLDWGFRVGAAARSVGTLDAVPTTGGGTVAAIGGGKGTAGTTGAGTASRSGDGLVAGALGDLGDLSGIIGSPPWWLVLLLVPALLVALLRARVLLLRRVRRAGPLPRPRVVGLQGPIPQLREPARDRRRVTRAARPAPAAAPSIAPRTVNVLPAGRPLPSESPEAADTGS